MNARRLALLLALAAPCASAQFTLPDWTVDSGGGLAQGLRFRLEGTIGQPDASDTLRGTRFALAGGFWADVPLDRVFRDGFEDD